MGISLQPQASTVTAYREQPGPGVFAANDAQARIFRATSGSGLRLTKGTVASAEVRSDLQSQRDRHGLRQTGGELGGELSLGTFDDLLQAVMRSTWSAVLTPTAFNITSYDPLTGLLTRAAGSFLTDGFRVGDVIVLGNAGVNSGIPVVLAAVGTTTATIGTRTSWTTMGALTAVTMTRSKKLVLGTTRRFFTVEHWAPFIANSERFLDTRVSSVTFRFERGANIGVTFGFTGRDMTPFTTQLFTSATNSTSLQMSAADASAVVLGAQSLTVTSCTITLSLNHTVPEVAGSTTAPDVIEGQATVTGSLSFYVTSQAQLSAFLAETQVVLSLLFRELGTAGFIGVSLTNLTFGAYEIERIANTDAQIVTVPLVVGIAAGADRDASMLTIQASNA